MSVPDDDPFAGIVFRTASEAFERALAQGRLVRNAKAYNYVAHFMYMGTRASTGLDLFKHIYTREYLPPRT